MALDAEGGQPAVTDIDDAGILPGPTPPRVPRWGTDGDEPGRTCRSSAPTTSPSTWPARPGEDPPEQAENRLVLLVGHAQSLVSWVSDGHAGTREWRNPSRRIRPSPEPSSSSTPRSGWGITPTTLPRSLATAAAPCCEPLGSSMYLRMSAGIAGIDPVALV